MEKDFRQCAEANDIKEFKDSNKGRRLEIFLRKIEGHLEEVLNDTEILQPYNSHWCLT